MKKAIGALLAAVMTMACVGCTPTPTPTPVTETLTAPFNVKVSDEGVVTWVGDVNATEYIVTVDGVEHNVYTPYFYLEQGVDASFTIVARADGYGDSVPVTGQYKSPTVTVGIRGNSEVHPGQRVPFRANVINSDNKEVDWKVVDGDEYATISENGILTVADADKITSDRLITVQATSKADPTAFARKTVTITVKSELTQAMLDELKGDKISFEGYVNVNLYEFGISNKFYRSFTSDIKTAMDGTHWYTEYADASTGITSDLYFEKYNDVANQVSVSFMNEEEYVPMLDDDGIAVSWTDAGLYNNFNELSLEDFTFNNETWRWEYSGDDETLVSRMVASANPYDFVPTNLALIITDGHIAGIYSLAKPDLTLVEQYEAVQELTAVINVGDDVKVPTIKKFEHAEVHDKLQTAINNMRALDSYTVDFLNIGGSTFTSGYTLSGYTETVTNDICHFRPYDQNTYGSGDSVIKKYTGANYGYVKRSDNLYNSYSVDADNNYSANRAFESEFVGAKPSFEFAAEIFNAYYEDAENGTTTFYVHSAMSSVASTFYKGVGNDISLYGLYATEGRTSQTSSFTPYVTVKDGYIVDSCFYYYLGYMYGVVEITYSDFDNASVAEDVKTALSVLETRQVPTSWDEVDIISTPDSSDTEHVENGLSYLQKFFGSDEEPDTTISDKLPFFGDALGDTYGFGLTTNRIPAGSTRLVEMIVFYYDVPLDLNYSIDSSIAAVEELLVANGYSKSRNGIFTKDYVAVQVVDSSLDLNIYVWKVI